MPALATDDVEMPELGDALVDGGRQCHAVPHVGDRGEGALPFLLDQSRGLVEVLRSGQRILVGFNVRTQVHRNNVGPLRGKHACVRTPLTARGSADHGHLARHPAHSPSFMSVRTFRPGTQSRSLPEFLGWLGSDCELADAAIRHVGTASRIGIGPMLGSIASLPRKLRPG